MENIAAVMKAAAAHTSDGSASMSDLLECTVLLRDIKNDFDAMNAAYKSAFSDGVYPARVAFQADLAGKAAVEVKCNGELPSFDKTSVQGRSEAVPRADLP